MKDSYNGPNPTGKLKLLKAKAQFDPLAGPLHTQRGPTTGYPPGSAKKGKAPLSIPKGGKLCTYVDFSIAQLRAEQSLLNVGALAFEITNPSGKSLSVRLQIRMQGQNTLEKERFVTQASKVAALPKFVMGLDQATARIAQPSYESGDILALVVIPPVPNIEVRAGTI